jgi:hypothetical protein
MPATKKPRKKYRPKPKFMDPVGWTVESNKLLRDHGDYAVTCKIRANDAMLALTQGRADLQSMGDLLAAHNVTLGLVGSLDYPDDTYITLRSQKALEDVVLRHKEVGRYVLKGSEMAAINDMLSLHDEFLDHVTVRQMEEALRYIKRRSPEAVHLP